MDSIFTPLKAEGLTTLKIRYDYKTGGFRFFAAREWDRDFDFSRYNKDFFIDGIFTDEAVYLNTAQVLELYGKYNLEAYLGQVQDLIAKGRHFGVDAYYNHRRNIRYLMFEHSRRLGINNKSHAIMAGGIRRHPEEEAEMDVIIDGLNLSRGMSFKNVAAGLAFGGCKAVVQMAPLNLNDMEAMGFLAFALDSCRDMTGPDMNFPTEMSDVMKHMAFSVQYTGGPSSRTGETGKPTAYGVYLTLKQAIKFREGTESLDGKSVALMGLGAVGWQMGEYLLQEDIKLYIADADHGKALGFLERHPGREVEIVSTDDILEVNADILCPCAVGGLFDDAIIPRLKCRYIWGAANNQLRASSQEEECRLASLLAGRDILYQVEWWHNTAGVMCGAEEYLYDGTPETLLRKIRDILPSSTWKNLNEAQEKGITPTKCAYMTCEQAVYGEVL